MFKVWYIWGIFYGCLVDRLKHALCENFCEDTGTIQNGGKGLCGRKVPFIVHVAFVVKKKAFDVGETVWRRIL